jgi:hypothetical protein
MADIRGMRTGNLKVAGPAILLALAALALAACGAGGDPTTTVQPPQVSATTADHLAKLSNRVASDLDAGDTCHAAHAADDLRAAVQQSDLPQTMRPSVDEVAGSLVDQVNCPPPPPPPPEPKKKPKNKVDGQHGDGHGSDGSSGQGHSDHGGFVPPGQAKLKGEGD